MDEQQRKVDNDSSDQNRSQHLPNSATNNNENTSRTTSSSLSSRVSHILTLRPSMDTYEDEHHVAHPVGQRLTLGSFARSGKIATINRPTITRDVSLADENEVAVVVSQFRRSQAPHPYEYKPSANLKEHTGAKLRTTTMALSGHHEQAQGTPVNVHHVRRQQPRGTKQKATFISQVNTAINYADLGESAVHLDQIHRPNAPEPIRYKPPAHIRSSISSIRKTTSVLGHEALPQETSIHITQLRQPTPRNRSTFVQTKQQASSILQPSTISVSPILGDTAVRLDQIRRPEIPQTIQYKPPADIQPSTNFIKKTAGALGQHELAQEAPVIIAQVRQPVSADLSVASEHRRKHI